MRLAWQNRILQTCWNRTVFKRHRSELTSMISLSESCDCRMDYWQSSPTCSVGNTSKIGWNTHLVHYCIDGWDLILFHLNQTIHAMYKDYLGKSADGSVFFAAGSQGGQSISYPFPARGGPAPSSCSFPSHNDRPTGPVLLPVSWPLSSIGFSTSHSLSWRHRCRRSRGSGRP